MSRLPRKGSSVDRPIQLVSLKLDVRLAVAADIDDDELARRLSSLAQAGLHGMVLGVERVELNGRRFGDAESLDPLRGDPERIRPAPDQRILATVPKLVAVIQDLCTASGIKLPELLDAAEPDESGAAS